MGRATKVSTTATSTPAAATLDQLRREDQQAEHRNRPISATLASPSWKLRIPRRRRSALRPRSGAGQVDREEPRPAEPSGEAVGDPRDGQGQHGVERLGREPDRRRSAAPARPTPAPTSSPTSGWSNASLRIWPPPGSPMTISSVVRVTTMATGSFAPDSTFRIAASCGGRRIPRSIENTAAASVEPTTAPISAAVSELDVEHEPHTERGEGRREQHPDGGEHPAGPAARRRSVGLVVRPPSNRMTRRATTPRFWTSDGSSRRMIAKPSSPTSIPRPRNSRADGRLDPPGQARRRRRRGRAGRGDEHDGVDRQSDRHHAPPPAARSRSGQDGPYRARAEPGSSARRGRLCDGPVTDRAVDARARRRHGSSAGGSGAHHHRRLRPPRCRDRRAALAGPRHRRRDPRRRSRWPSTGSGRPSTARRSSATAPTATCSSGQGSPGPTA